MPDDVAPLLDVPRVRAALAGTRFAGVRYVRETASTNDDAVPMLGDPSAAGATLVAEFQRAGRGRKAGRTWIAAPGSALLFTAILPVEVEAASLWAVPFWTALAVADGVEAASGVRLELRWPNDLDLAGRKAGGILCVSRVAGARAHAACGVGLNVRRPAVPPPVEPPPAYLSDAAPHAAREDILAGILGAMDALVDVLARPDDTARAWEERAGLRGRPYRLRLDADGSVVSGRALRLADDGGIVIDDGAGERTIHLADARVI
ncbi:MAG TPA: biotin--[acetyl-CoA-carboxylase] ligase [Candidatus Elarobacter sp.]|nr:biotin--[acetyl-CoA-carboxylase] ligase [Candidatus Elarobacter sp.]